MCDLEVFGLDYSFVKAFDIAASIVEEVETSPHPQFMNRWIGCEDSTVSMVGGGWAHSPTNPHHADDYDIKISDCTCINM